MFSISSQNILKKCLIEVFLFNNQNICERKLLNFYVVKLEDFGWLLKLNYQTQLPTWQ